jgi:hypothetical protein
MSTLQFFLLIGTIVFSAYVAVRVFGLDVGSSYTGKGQGGDKWLSDRWR